MKTNVIFLKKDFIVNPKKKAVYCKILCSIKLNTIPGINMLVHCDAFNEYFAKRINEYVGDLLYDYDNNEVWFMCDAVAKCAPEDTYDENLGKKIALTRAQQVAFRTAAEFYDDILSIVEKEFDNLYTMLDGSIGAEIKCGDHQKELLGIYY